MKHWLVIYDITDGKRLARVARIMKNHAIRVQKSIFEAEADDKTIDKLRKEIRLEIEGDDSVIFFDICEADWQKKVKYGQGKHIASDDVPYRIL